MTPIEELIEHAAVSGIGSVALRQLRDAYAAECMEQAQARAHDGEEILSLEAEVARLQKLLASTSTWGEMYRLQTDTLEAEVARLKSDGACGWGDWPTAYAAEQRKP